MAVHLSFLFILTAVTGIHSVNTVSKVSVKAGDSITIPCLYGSQYMNNVKYLCKGYYWSSCSYAVKTNQPHSSGKFSISDDKNQRIFTVTIKDLMNTDTDYWCNVEINGRVDVGQYFHLSITTDTPSLSVDHQEITGFIGESINISCYYRNSGERRWCRLGMNCVTGSSVSMDGTSVTISATVPNVFTVTMSGLKTESSGWYYCVKGELQMPVHVTVTERPTTTTSSSPTPKPVNTTSDSLPSVTANRKGFFIPLSLLIVIVLVILFMWFTFRKVNKQTEAESSTTATAEEEVKYSTIKHKRKPGQGSDAKSDGEVMYSSAVKPAVKQQMEKRVEATAEDVTYSTLAQSKQNL